MTDTESGWKRCSACKRPIPHGSMYYVCNVSTCNRKRTGLAFCTVSCWEVHLPIARHRESWAEERTAPTAAEAARQKQAEADGTRAPRRRIVEPAARTPAAGPSGDTSSANSSEAAAREVLIVASRLKDYVRAVSGMNTSDRVLEPLSQIVREAVGRAIANARRDERKTLLDRDIPKD